MEEELIIETRTAKESIFQKMKSDMIGNIALALSKAQGEIEGAKKNTNNPYYSTKYADLGSVWDACREPLSKNDLAVSQLLRPSENGKIIVGTMLIHKSGEWLYSEIKMTPVREKKGEGFIESADPQSIGKVIAYARRYGLAAIVGIYQEDDDANIATQKDQPSEKTSSTQEKEAEVVPLKKPLSKEESINLDLELMGEDIPKFCPCGYALKPTQIDFYMNHPEKEALCWVCSKSKENKQPYGKERISA